MCPGKSTRPESQKFKVICSDIVGRGTILGYVRPCSKRSGPFHKFPLTDTREVSVYCGGPDGQFGTGYSRGKNKCRVPDAQSRPPLCVLSRPVSVASYRANFSVYEIFP